jgi:hypothetical protein
MPRTTEPTLTKKAFREFLNREHATSPKHRHARFQQRTRPYGDYLYAQDREMFNVEYADWVRRQQPKPTFKTPDEIIRETGCLRRFAPNQRVRVIDAESPLYGMAGTVWRVCIGGLGPWSQSGDGTIWNIPEAWVRFHSPIPESERSFPASDSRGNSVKMRADQCAALATVSSPESKE